MTSSAEAWRICALEEDELEAVLELSVADARREQEELESPTPSSESSSLFYDDAFDYYLEELSAVHSEEENNAILRWEEDRDRAGLDFESETHVQMHTLLFTQHLAFDSSSIAMLGGKAILPKPCNALILCFLGPRFGPKVRDRVGRTDSMRVLPDKVIDCSCWSCRQTRITHWLGA